MPVPVTFADISETASSNSPQGSETVGTQANEYIQAGFAFSKQLYDGKWLPTQDVPLNNNKLTGVKPGSTASTSTDAINGSQLVAMAYKVGEVRMWHGAAASIASTWGTGWQLADGTNGTADLRSRFIVGAGTDYATNATGGLNSVMLTAAQMPSHTHVLNDPGHNHVLNQTPHSHLVNDPGHSHSLASGRPLASAGGSGTLAGGGSAAVSDITASATGISLQAQLANVSLNSASTGITMVSAGNDNFHENRPPYYALCFVEYTGIGA